MVTVISSGLGRFPMQQVRRMFLNPQPNMLSHAELGVKTVRVNTFLISPSLLRGCEKRPRDLRCDRGNYFPNPVPHATSIIPQSYRSPRQRPLPTHHAGFRIPNNAGVSDTCCAYAPSATALDPPPARPPRKAVHSRQGDNYELTRIDSALSLPKWSRTQQAERHAFRWRRQ